MDYKLMHPGKYIEACDLKGQHVTVTIESVVLHDLEQEEKVKDGEQRKPVKRKERKGLISFCGKQKGLIPARTVSECLVAMFGRDTDGWLGKRVTLKPAVVEERGQFFGQPCVRVAGSPDIPREITFELRLPRKGPRMVTLTKTPAGSRAATSPDPVPGQGSTREVQNGDTSGANPATPATPASMDAPPADWRSDSEVT